MKFVLILLVLVALSSETEAETCADKQATQNCEAWKGSGYCAKDSIYRSFMEGNCQKTCSFCTEKNCLNNEAYSQHCPVWKSLSYCNAGSPHYGFMKQHCQLECGICTVNKVEVKPSCTDSGKYDTCDYWKANGLCKPTSQYYGFMNDHCKKTCGFCTDECKDHADAKFCSLYQPYCKNAMVGATVSHNCPKTCGVCKEAVVCGKGLDLSGRVVGGVNAEKGSWPWQAIIKLNGKGICGGTLIAKKWVLTAAHCMKVSGREVTESEVEVILGKQDKTKVEGTEQAFYVLRIVRHPKHNSETKDSDVTLLELNEEAKLNTYVGLACLPTEAPKLKLESTCYITGFGKTDGFAEKGSDILQQARLPVVSNSECSILNKYPKVTDNMLCAGYGLDFSHNESGCRGDSGGPFVCSKDNVWYVQGIVSWGSSTCISGEKFTVFARVLNYVDWIKQTIE